MRREKALAQIHATGWDFELFEAVDSRTRDRKSLPVPRDGWFMGVGEVACYFSHLGVFQRICDEDLDYGLVLEDDFELIQDTDMNLATVWNLLPEGADHVQLHNHQAADYSRYRVVESADRFNRVCPTNYGCWAYIISRRLAEHILAHHSMPKRPIDDLFIRLSRTLKHTFNFHDTSEKLVGTYWTDESSINRKTLAPRSTRLMLRGWLQQWRNRRQKASNLSR